MSTTTHAITAERLLEMGTDAHYELIKGELRPMSPGGIEHGIVIMRLVARLIPFVDGKNLGVLCAAETGFVLQRGPDTVLAPDIAFISRDRLPLLRRPQGFGEGAPDLVVEVRSHSQSARDMRDKAEEWLALGATLVWTIDPLKQTAAVYRRGRETRVLTANDFLDGEDIVPGFSIRLGEIF